jgi:UDP-N-acetylmuramate dehydrogenase
MNEEALLSELSTFRMGGTAKNIVPIRAEEDLEAFFTTPQDGFFILGGGSNVVFPDAGISTTILQIKILGIQKQNETNEGVELIIGAGENWDSVVEYAVDRGYSGVEALSAIPGTAGATPVQNVGAYGTEIKDVLLSVRVYDVLEKRFKTLTNAECAFAYRDSIFKHTAKGKYVITQITLKLFKKAPGIPEYPGVRDYLLEKGIYTPSLCDIRNAITAIRWKKLPDPKEIASCGSFFKNPIVPKELADSLKEKYPKLAVFSVSEALSKVGAGSLIDTLGWKGKKIGNFSFYTGNAVVVVHEGGGTQAELRDLIETVNESIQKAYGITLEPEPEIL